MRDPRCKELAKNLVEYSCNVQPGEKVLIESIGDTENLCIELIEAVYERGGIPYLNLQNPVLTAAITKGVTKESLETARKWEEIRMKEMDCYIGIRAGENVYSSKSVPSEKQELESKYLWQPVHGKIRVNETKWVILRYPNNSMSQLAKMPTEEFEDYYFSVCNLDYAAMSKAMTPLEELMNKTDKVRIVSPGTDLTFSIKDIPAVKCDGHCNIPDGEVYTAPVKNSINGTIRYNTPSPYNGFTFENVELTFKDGKIVDIKANDTERAEKIFNTDEGARYVGEFAFGVNPKVSEAIGDILFDEKIAGSIHFTPGACYEDAWNGNESAVHWDLVLCQRPEFGGGEIYFDDVLIRKDGQFVLPELEALNY